MMVLVRIALRRPYTFVTMALLIALLGVRAIVTMPVDIFPSIDIPVVSIVWSYDGLSPDEMEKRVVTICERALTTTVNNIEHLESRSYNGIAIIRVYFQRGVSIDLAIAQITSLVQTILRVLPPGIFPPLILKYDASTVPILQLGVSSPRLTEQQLFDYAQNFVRTDLATIEGASVPLPYGGKSRAIMVDLDPRALYAKQLSASDISDAVSAQSLILPAGTAKMGDKEYLVRINSSPAIVDAFNALPVKTVNGGTVTVGDVAHVRDGFLVQTNIVRYNGVRGAMLSVLKNGATSTLDIVGNVKRMIPITLAGLSPDLHITPLFDQSIFVRAAVWGVVREAVIAAGLTGLMILLFLGSVRSTFIIWVSIPLSILTALILLDALGYTINIMTLSGLALAVGILVDDATVEIENTNRNLAMRKPLVTAILDGAQQIATPAFVSTLAICIVFVPVLLLTGTAGFLFTPLALAVVLAMITSYMLSRTLVPTMVHYLLPPEVPRLQHGEAHAGGGGLIWRVHTAFEIRFERLRDRYRALLETILAHRALVTLVFLITAIGSLGLAPLVGRDFFPTVDAGQIQLHVRAPVGTRIEETEALFADIEREIKRIVPADELQAILDNIGLPSGGINLAFSGSAAIGRNDGDILISLHPERHGPTATYIRQIREMLRRTFPQTTFFFQPADITTQILNFGLPAALDVQITGRSVGEDYAIAREVERRVAAVPGAVDVTLFQVVDYPELRLNVDRAKADQLGLTQRDVANSLLVSLTGNGQIAPNQWLSPTNGVSYSVVVQTPQYRVDSVPTLQRTPVTASGTGSTRAPVTDSTTTPAPPNEGTLAYANPYAAGPRTQLLGNLSTETRGVSPQVIDHYNIRPVFNVFANVDRRDLGSVAAAIDRILDDVRPRLPRGSAIELGGQARTMNQSFENLALGLLSAVILVYLLMAVNFQSWIDPLIVISTIPGALAGIVWMLFVTGTTFSVPSLMGAIMCIGVATANSILLVTFANDEQEAGKDSMAAALSAGYVRMRPVLMTALAMMLGMLPMALGFGEGGEQNAPLGRAVIGGLLMATASTLLFVPVVYSYLRTRPPVDFERRLAEEAATGTGGEA
jgi:multidrug efflux pump subunit AcrB